MARNSNPSIKEQLEKEQAANVPRPVYDEVNARIQTAEQNLYGQASTLGRRMSTKEEIEQKIKYYQDKIEKLWSLKIRLDESRCEDILNSIKTEFDYL